MKTYWHFLPDTGCLRFPPHTQVRVGKTLRFDGEPILCKQGFHASARILDALGYMQSSICCSVTLGGITVEHSDKTVAQERTALWIGDISQTLHEFACDVAEAALLRKAHVTDDHGWAAIATKRKWLLGEASDEQLDAARDAAWGAAWGAAVAGAGDAAWTAVEAAAREAARDTAAWGAARDAARDAANAVLEARVNNLIEADR